VSVYTFVTRSDLEFFFDRYALGTVKRFEGINNGIDNSNYFVDTTQGQFVLTLFERLTLAELPHLIKLMTTLHHYHIPCPIPQLDKQGNALRLLSNKPAAIFKRLAGSTVEHIDIQHCTQLGLQLAELHDCTQHYSFPYTINVLNDCQKLFHQLGAHLNSADSYLIMDELYFQTQNYPKHLPTGVIHADLFRDNVLFDGDKLSGILDFYSAGIGDLLLDLAIAANDWCCDKGIINPDKVSALVSAYETLRPLHSNEKRHWQTLLRAAALRFWLSRLVHQYYPRLGNIVQEKDPLFFRQLLEQHRNSVEETRWIPNKAVNLTVGSKL
jgi:homoserine kinase type II